MIREDIDRKVFIYDSRYDLFIKIGIDLKFKMNRIYVMQHLRRDIIFDVYKAVLNEDGDIVVDNDKVGVLPFFSIND